MIVIAGAVLVLIGIGTLCSLVRPGRCLYQVVWTGFGMLLGALIWLVLVGHLVR